MKNTVKTIVKSVSFLLIVAIIWCAITLWVRPTDQMTIYEEPDNTVDMLMVGSSAWYTFWAPMASYEACGYTSFNYAQGGMPADLMKYCIIETLKHQKPSLVCIDARTFVYRAENTVYITEEGEEYLKDNYVRTVSDTMPLSLNRMKMILDISPKLEDPLSNFADLLFYHDEWKQAMNKGTVVKGRDYTKGFDIHTKTTAYDKPANMSGITAELELPESAEAALRDLLEYCSKQEFKTIFVALPVASEDDEMKMQYNYMSRICSEYGIPMIDSNDYSDEIGLNYETDFDDETHANYNGTTKFTAWFSLYVMKNYPLADRRGQEGYEFWDEDLSKWNGLLDAVFPDRVAGNTNENGGGN